MGFLGQRVTGYGLRVTGYGLRVTGYGVRGTGYGLRVTEKIGLDTLPPLGVLPKAKSLILCCGCR